MTSLWQFGHRTFFLASSLMPNMSKGVDVSPCHRVDRSEGGSSGITNLSISHYSGIVSTWRCGAARVLTNDLAIYSLSLSSPPSFRCEMSSANQLLSIITKINSWSRYDIPWIQKICMPYLVWNWASRFMIGWQKIHTITTSTGGRYDFKIDSGVIVLCASWYSG